MMFSTGTLNLGGVGFVPAEPEYSLRQARIVLDRLGVLPVELEHVLGPGRCEDCRRATLIRYRYGAYVVCRQCAGSRVRAGQQVAALEAQERERP